MRKLMWFALGFTAACTLGTYVYSGLLFPAAVTVFSLSLLVLALTHWFAKLKITAAILLGLSVGLGWFCIYDRVNLQAARYLEGVTQFADIEVMDYAVGTDRGCRADGRMGRYLLRVQLDSDIGLEPGNRISGEFRFAFTVNKSEYYQSEGIFLVAYPTGDVTLDTETQPKWYHYPAIWRADLAKKIDASFPEDTAGFAKALLIGDRSDISYEQNTAFKLSGISHIIAVSGMHVSILFGLIYLLTARRRVLTALIGIPAVLTFAAIAGFSPSITRAAIMQILMMLAMLWEREYDPLTALAFSALVMEAVNPMVVSSVSFQLSMGCMLGIFLFSEPIRAWLMEKSRLGRWKVKLTRWFSSSLSVTLGAAVMTTPLVAWHFGCVSLIGTVTNVLVLWVISFIFYGVMAVCILACFSPVLAAVLGCLTAIPIRFVLLTARLLSSFPLAAVYTKSVYITVWLMGAYVLLGLYFLLKRKPAAMLTAVLVLSLICAVGLAWLEPGLWECHVTVVDVGQGQAVILRGGGKTFLVDCGGDYDEGAADAAAETLLSMGISRLDGIFITHLDADHAGGVPYLLSRIRTDAVYLPRMRDPRGYTDALVELLPGGVKVIGEDTAFSYDGGRLTVFAPLSYDSGNESSMCILFQTENCDILITGDRGVTGEELLLRYHTLPELEVLIVGHHGSKHSTGQALLQATRPEYAIISAGEGNRYGHPAPETLARLAAWGCQVFCTADGGSIIFRR